ncbi:hypothetical protein DFP72DRAFT_866688 [Ephemerocybe angulata]|uniref:GYF domain-containing protein n=1 Tax=Ephemerocybe angulata TaxID=980116 RepID=A0A8H6IKZ5_9AGAR|nr:hypothetical protein DFP72DRAFT_866688 [Tulosesus angulatus]
MSTTTMHFGPEWMRAKQQPQARPQAPPSPPPASNLQSATSTYSALVSAIPTSQNEKQDEGHPFRYTKEELLRIYKDSPKGSLGLEVERWDGVVREIGSDPVGLKDMGEGEKKLFAGPLNSDLRRRQSTDFLSPLNLSTLGTERPRLHQSPSTNGSPLRERYPGLKRRDSNADSPTVPTLTRKTSLSALQSPSLTTRNPGLPSPRVRQGFNGGGFDGVLGAGESWSSRRRISEATRPGAISRDSSGGLSGGREGVNTNGEHGRGGSAVDSPSTPDPSSRDQGNPGDTQVNGAVGNAISNQPTEPKDLAAVEWSYKDPAGNIQGPFRADLMQKWFDDGYFAAELPMKRVQYDSNWMTVAELIQRTTNDKLVFLSPLRPIGPPGLSKREASPLHALTQPPDNIFNNPYQPAPIRSLRSSTLDSFNGSNPSDSPSSSIGHFGNNSPDPLAFGGMSGNGHSYIGDAVGGLGFAGVAGGLDIGGLRRTHHLQDFHDPNRLHSPSYGNMIGHQGFANNGHGFPNQYNTVQSSPWGTPTHDPFAAAYSGAYNTGAYPQPAFNTQLPNQVINPLLYGGADLGQLTPNHQFNAHNGAIANEQQNYGNNPQGYDTQQYQQPITPSEAKPSGEYPSHQEGQGIAPVAWDSSAESTARRQGLFDSTHPTTINTSVPTASSQSSPWGQPQPAPSAQPAVSRDASPWVLASQGVLETPWAAPVEPEVAKLPKLDEEPAESHDVPVEPEALAPPAASSAVESTPTPAPKSKKSKSSAPPPLPAPASATSTSTPADSPTPSPATPATQKAPWAKDDKKRTKAGGTTVSLREIQEAEAKAAEVRKSKEEKERASRLAASASVSSDSKDDVQPFTASWGLPTSQTGGRTASFAKESASASGTPVSPVSPPVWTNAPKTSVVKKTMKEIQEEEERRKKTATKETVAAAAAKRAYAESTAKAASPTTAPTNSAWVTVGSSGKTSSPATAPPRPTLASVASSASVRSNGPSALRPAQTSAVKTTAVPSGGKVEDFPVSPSHEFLKWLTESLKGLNNSVNVEEIISMLLSFSLDPDPTTIEIIQETIYYNSTTLDGRRFAAEFVAKRKADAANRKSGTSAGKAAVKPVSIAEVVKATPKASTPEWGGFKVVNKKKKGGRS